MNNMINSEVENLIGSYSASYNRKFWNKGLQESQLSDSEWGITSKKCSAVNCTSNVFGGAEQCYGYSLFIAYLISGEKLSSAQIESAGDGQVIANGWTVCKNNLTSLTLEPGDIIRTGTSSVSGHSAVVWEVFDNGTFKVTECWGSASYGCELYWGYFNGGSDENQKNVSQILQDARYIIKAPKTYTIKNAGSGKYLTVMTTPAADGGRVVQLTAENTARQKWIASPSAGNGHILSSLNSGLAIKYTSASDNYCRIYNHSNSDPAAINIVVSGSYYNIKTTKGGNDYYLAADASGSNVYWTSGDSTAYQKWTFTQVS
jgi:hypothetical protein